jgi:ribosome-associated protein
VAPERPSILEIHPRIRIPLAEMHFGYARSSGPGGQHVNKVNTKVTLHWSVAASPSLPDDVRARFVAKFHQRINQQGELVIHSQRFRDQAKNVDDCLDKLGAMLLEVATPPKRRKPTRATRASKYRRLRTKQFQSQRKNLRRQPGME